MSFLGFIGQVVPWARQRAVGEGGFGKMLERLKPWGKKATETAAAGGAGGDKGGSPPVSAGGLPNEDWLLSGTWLHLASSNVHAIRYLYDEQILEVEFKKGPAFYQYFSVGPETASDMTLTDSPGRFVWQRLRDRFPYVKLSGVSGKGLVRPPSVIRTPTPKEMVTKWKGVKPIMGLKAPWQKS